MKYLRITPAVLILGLSLPVLFGAPPRPPQQTPISPTLTPEAGQAIKTAFPGAAIATVRRNIDRGTQVYEVTLSGDKATDSVEITAAGMVMQSGVKLGRKELPAAVAKAAAAASEDGKFIGAEKLDLRVEFTPKAYNSDITKVKLVPLAQPVTAYDVTYVKDGTTGVIRLAPDGQVISPMNWMKRASVDVPPGKLVIRANLGCIIDYTDKSGIVWSADKQYTKENKWGWLDGRPNMRLGLVVPGTDAPFMYDSERDKEGAYRFDVPNGTYTVRIHFCETWEGARQPNIREFGIKIQGKELVNKMDIAGAAGGWMIPMVKEFKDIAVTDGKLIVEPFTNNNRDQHPSIEAYDVYAQ